MLEEILMLGKIEGKRRKEQQKMKWLNSITNSIDKTCSKFREIVDDQEDVHASVHGVTKSQTQLSE